jgi:uncharacterized protein YdaU (DUF1376 family)
MWWWIDRWRKSSAYAAMTLEEQGAYRNLLDEAHLRGGLLSSDERVLAKACGDAHRWRRVRAKVLAHFTQTPEGWRHETLDAVLHESQRLARNQRAYRRRRAGHGPDNGTNNGGDNGPITEPITRPITARSRADNKRDNNADIKAASPSPSPSPSLKKEREKETHAATNGQRVSLSVSISRDPFLDAATTDRAGAFVRRYQALYPQYRNGARYAVRETRDYAAAVKLCETWPDDSRLEKLAICFLTTDHKFAAEGSRTIPQFLALASWADGELAAWELQHPVPRRES